MSKKNKTLEELQRNIDDNFVIRRNELKLLKDLVEKYKKQDEGKVYSKQLIVLLYSHWEGFIKFSTECLIQFIHSQNFKNYDLNFGLLAISNLEIINNFLESRISLKIKAIETLFEVYEKRSSIPYSYSVATYSNLNTETLEEICLIIGIDENNYIIKKGIIDEKLLFNRNQIAHGMLIRIDPHESLEIYNLVFPILESFKIDILNRAVLLKHSKRV